MRGESSCQLGSVVLFGCLLLAMPLHAQRKSGIDTEKAREAFAEAKALSIRDGGRLWGKPLYGPMLFVLPSTHEVVANEADPEGKLHAEGDVYVGTLPKEIILGNTATEWERKRWTMVLWPLPEYKATRDRLLMHELFHRIQPSLGLKLASPENPQLDTFEGRLWLQLEWRALALAVIETGQPQKQAISDALTFREHRFSLFPNARASENALEMNEGLAEYTGLEASALDLASARWRVVQRLIAPESNTFVRSFAYSSGPAYGLLLDRLSPAWRVGLKPDADLAALLAQSAASHPSLEASKRADSYGVATLEASEKERSAIAEAGRARYISLLVSGPTLTLPNAGKFSYGFNPNELVPLGTAGTVYPSMQASDEWGALEVEDGALLSGDFKKLTIAAPTSVEGSPIKGPGWTLKLSAGWTIMPNAHKPGSYVLEK